MDSRSAGPRPMLQLVLKSIIITQWPPIQGAHLQGGCWFNGYPTSSPGYDVTGLAEAFSPLSSGSSDDMNAPSSSNEDEDD
ncbi:hypothetical protein CVT26_008656 [Gymnopilus dilepis]|uniref:Uncharacterized protein n=1 Tax=Gymnopilus dilepis TaxID=231916 RepID=A0A409XXY5_9AGAR|nr:hypothetical protein CVT26_008656 [Gymnopilus dilepis]